MIKYDVSIVGAMMVAKLKTEPGLTHIKLYRIRTVGLGTIIRHFEKVGNMMVDKQILRDFLDDYHANHYSDDGQLVQRWWAIRRAVEMLIYFSETGQVDMPILPSWTKRNCSLRFRPSAEQMADKENIYSLIWHTRMALKKIGYAPQTLVYYDNSGFAKVLEAHVFAGTETYSQEICAKVVLDTHELVARGLRHRYQGVRKAVALLEEFRRYGTLTPGTLSPFEHTELTPTFATLLDEYGNDVLFSEKQSEVTVKTGKSIIKGFLLGLEELGYTSFDDVTLSIIGQVVAKTASGHYKRGAESLLHYVRGFLKHLHDYGYIEVDLSVGVPKMASPYRKVYQGFTDGEIIRLLVAVDRDSIIGKRDYAMMVLAAQTGLRGVDIIKLKTSRNSRCLTACVYHNSQQDVNLQSGKIFIAESKGNRDRIIMLCGEILDTCRRYNEEANNFFPGRTFFFARNITDACNYGWFKHIFWRLISATQIENHYGVSPRLYDIRHTFATHRLYHWLKEGKDIHTMMPYLSAYMGHAKVSETYYYIHLVPGMHEEMSDFRYESAEHLFPKVVDSDE